MWTITPSILRHGLWTPWAETYWVRLTNVKVQDLTSASSSDSASYSLHLGILGKMFEVGAIATFSSVENLIHVVYPY